MSSNTNASSNTTYDTVPTGSTILGVGDFTANGIDDILFANQGTLYTLNQPGTRSIRTTLGTLAAGETFVGVGTYIPGENDVLIESSTGLISYITAQRGTLSSSRGTSVAAIQSDQIFVSALNYDNDPFGGTNPPQPIFVSENPTVGRYFYNGTIPVAIPAGFTVVPNSAGNYLDTDVSSLLIENGNGTVSAFAAITWNNTVLGTAAVVSLGTLTAGQSIIAESSRNLDGSTDILIQQGDALTEWAVNRGSVIAATNLGNIPIGFTVAGMGNLSGNGAADVVLANASGTIETISGPVPLVASGAPLAAQSPVIMQNYSYNGQEPSQSQLFSNIPWLDGANGLLTIGSPCYASYEEVGAGNETEAAWEGNVAALEEIGQYCNANGIGVQLETAMGGGEPNGGNGNVNIAAPQIEQFLYPLVAAGVPVDYVNCNNEIESNYLNLSNGYVQVMNISDQEFQSQYSTIAAMMTTWAQALLQNFAIIHAAYPNAQFGEWEQIGQWETMPETSNSAPGSGEGDVLKLWLETINSLAASENLPGISYIIIDQFISPNYGTIAPGQLGVSDSGIATGGTADFLPANVGGLIQAVGSLGVKAIISSQILAESLNGLQGAAQQELEISQEASLGAAGFQLDPSFSTLPFSDAVNEPGATYNTDALASGIMPLYAAGAINATGSVVLGLPSQLVVAPGGVVSLGGLKLTATATDQNNKLAVVLIDQTGTLSVNIGGQDAQASGDGTNDLVLDGTPAQIAASLASLKIQEAVSGPDQVDVEVFGASGRIGGGTIAVLSTNGSLSFLPAAGGASPVIWTSASATVTGGKISTEALTWNTSDGLSTSLVGGSLALPIDQIMVQQPLVEAHAGHETDTLGDESAPVMVSQSVLGFDLNTGSLQTQTDTIAPVPSSMVTHYNTSYGQYYFTNGGSAVTQYNTGNNPNWPGSTSGLYANGGTTTLGDALVASFTGTTLTVSDGSVNPMVVGSIQTIYGNVNGQSKVVEVRYIGGPSNPYDEIDEVFDPSAPTPTVWQLLNTVGVPASMIGANSAPLPVPSATTIVEYNTGDNPNWTFGATATEVADTYQAGLLITSTTVSSSSINSYSGPGSTLEEGSIIANYDLSAPPKITSAVFSTSSGMFMIDGTGIAGNWIVVKNSSNGLMVTQIGADGRWAVSVSYSENPAGLSVQEYDLLGDCSSVVPVSTTAVLGPPAIAGTVAGQTTTNAVALAPFALVVITDPNASQSELVRISLSSPANGTFGNLGGGSYNAATGTYTISGSAAAVSAALHALIFQPAQPHVALGQTFATGFTISVTDTAGMSASNNTTSVVTTAVTASSVSGISLVQSSGQYILWNSGGTCPLLTLSGSAVTVGQFGSVVPIAAARTATGYEVAWAAPGSNTYYIWNTDANGNYVSTMLSGVSGSSPSLEVLEPNFGLDLNGDGTVGLKANQIIETNGTTSLWLVGDEYVIAGGGGTGPLLTLSGSAVTVGQFGSGIVPVGAVKTTNGYEVAWNLGNGTYVVWNTDANGNYTGNATGVVGGTSCTLEALETAFGEDLNGDGKIGPTLTTLASNGTTALVQAANGYELNPSGGGTGPLLTLSGSAVTVGQFGSGIVPVGAVKTANGYEVAWNLGNGTYVVWNTDANGNYTGNATGVVAGQSFTLEDLEPTFGEDLNGDGRHSAVLVTGPGTGNVLNLSTQILATTIDLGSNIASASSGLSAPSLSFLSAPDAIILGSSADIVEYALQPSSGIEEVAGFVMGTDQLNIDLMGAASSTLVAYNTVVNGSHAIALASSSDLSHGIVLTNLTGGLTAASLLALHTTFVDGHALVR